MNQACELRAVLAPRIKEIGQRELARRIGVHQPMISQWLSGSKSLSLAKALVIAEGCGLKVKITIRGHGVNWTSGQSCDIVTTRPVEPEPTTPPPLP